MNNLFYYNQSLNFIVEPFYARHSEEQICIEFANFLRKNTCLGKIHAVWFHVANEGGRANMFQYGKKQRAMGKIAGVADYIFLRPNDPLALEFKAKKGALSPAQKFFKEWCAVVKIPYYLVRSAQEGIDILKEEGIYVP